MKIIEPHYQIMKGITQEDLLLIERAARTCYKSEDKAYNGSAAEMIRRLIKSGHHTPLEHVSMTVRFVVDRGVSHELVRHRLCAFSQESTRYCNYSKGKFGNEITVIKPSFFKGERFVLWGSAMSLAEKTYINLIQQGATAQEARSVLPNSLATEIVCTANIREWRHIFKLRCSKAAHPQMREIMVPLRDEMAATHDCLFGEGI